MFRVFQLALLALCCVPIVCCEKKSGLDEFSTLSMPPAFDGMRLERIMGKMPVEGVVRNVQGFPEGGKTKVSFRGETILLEGGRYQVVDLIDLDGEHVGKAIYVFED